MAVMVTMKKCGLFGLVLVLGCDGSQSALDPGGRAAERIAALFWWMTIGSVIIWFAIVGLALLVGGQQHRRRSLVYRRHLDECGIITVKLACGMYSSCSFATATCVATYPSAG